MDRRHFLKLGAMAAAGAALLTRAAPHDVYANANEAYHGVPRGLMFRINEESRTLEATNALFGQRPLEGHVVFGDGTGELVYITHAGEHSKMPRLGYGMDRHGHGRWTRTLSTRG